MYFTGNVAQNTFGSAFFGVQKSYRRLDLSIYGHVSFMTKNSTYYLPRTPLLGIYSIETHHGTVIIVTLEQLKHPSRPF